MRVGSALVVQDDAGRVLVGRRAKEPNRGRWVLPGGKVEPFESIASAARRELVEETGLEVAVGRQIGTFEIIRPPDEHRLIVYSWATVQGGMACPSSDISELAFIEPAALPALDLTEICVSVLTEAGLLRPRGASRSAVA